ncbi:hypothetical protein BDW59DRAFT_167312 [Aspergillus cavernicola]|uniref:EthD domain-containing protein n=1 Tax=Aspergillus cavernicola TaxID=176166 RepID=A0ABR4HEZ4_9EURO
MSYHTAVLYPNDEDTTFDESYYVQDHMPRAEKTWKKHGLYLIATFLVWENEEAVKKALQDPETPKLFADAPGSFGEHYAETNSFLYP